MQRTTRLFWSFISNNPIIPILALAVGIIIYGCFKSHPVEPVTPPTLSTTESSGEDFLNGALDEIEAIADWTGTHSLSNPKSRDRRLVLSGTTSDSIYVYGQVTPDGFGATVTERHQYPKGILLITVRKTHGANNGRMVTETKKYITFQNFQNGIASSTNLTELYTLSDTIVTRVLRNGLLETYTFRLPVVTRNVNSETGSVTVTRRFGSNGYIISEKKDGGGTLIQVSRSTGQSDGGLFTKTEYPDSTWRSTRTLGQADGSILREVTTGRGL